MSIKVNLSTPIKSKQTSNRLYYTTIIGNIIDTNKTAFTPQSLDSWSESLALLKGFFALVLETDNTIFATVDHTRSIPLFYCQYNNDFYLSTSSEWIKNSINLGDEMVTEYREEFQMLGYTLGNKTLYKPIKQLQAGECLSFSADGLQLQTYYTYNHIEPEKFNEEFFYQSFTEVVTSCFNRLINYADGRQLVIPLSGGYDSRLIVSILKNLKYSNVICFSYGVPGNLEAVHSKKIAESVGFKWIFIEYTDTAWKEVWSSNKAHLFREYAFNHSSLPHIQDWLALAKLNENNLIDEDAIFVPGHACITPYIPVDIRKNPSNNYYLEVILNKHFTGRPFKLNSEFTYTKAKELLLKEKNILNHYDALSEIMQFLWRERQAKYIINSVRAYEIYGYDWWLPLLDQELMALWQTVPLEKRLNRALYIQYVNTIFSQYISPDDSALMNNAGEILSIKGKISYGLKRFIPKRLYRLLLKSTRRGNYSNHFLKFGSLVKEESLNLYIKDDYSIIGIYSDLQLKGKWGEL